METAQCVECVRCKPSAEWLRRGGGELRPARVGEACGGSLGSTRRRARAQLPDSLPSPRPSRYGAQNKSTGYHPMDVEGYLYWQAAKARHMLGQNDAGAQLARRAVEMLSALPRGGTRKGQRPHPSRRWIADVVTLRNQMSSKPRRAKRDGGKGAGKGKKRGKKGKKKGRKKR